MTYVAPWYLEPQWFLPTFAVFWLLITGMLAHLGGWASLARGYATQQSASGDRFRFVSGSMGTRIFPVSYGNCLFVTVDAQGVYLSILFPFRFMAPPLYLPWARLEEVAESRFLFIRSVRMRVRDYWPQIRLKGTAGQAVLRAYQDWKTKCRK